MPRDFPSTIKAQHFATGLRLKQNQQYNLPWASQIPWLLWDWIYWALLFGLFMVARILQASWGKSVKQQQQLQPRTSHKGVPSRWRESQCGPRPVPRRPSLFLTVPKTKLADWSRHAERANACKKRVANHPIAPNRVSHHRPPNPDPRQRRIRSQTFQCGRCFLLPRLTRLSTALGSLRVKNMDLERRFFCKLLKLGVGQSGTTITNYFIQNILRTNRVKEEM